MPAATCLPRETLKQYLVGDVEESQTEAIESHLASCPACEQTVVELEANPETLLVGIRELAENPVPVTDVKVGEEPSVVKHALAAARQLPEASPRNAMEWPVGQIGAYELLRPLGRGGMGMVVLARHRNLQKEVAIKLLSSLVGDKPELVSRFQREMRAAGRLQHPAIVNATDAGQERGTHYLVMEYVAGLDLSRIARLVGKLPIADACELMRQTALGLSHAHAEGIVHRDVKPSNLMLDAMGHVKILDFGLAQINLWDEPVCELTTVGQLMGTIDYMAPEQAERIGAVDYRADLYALGATLFRLIAGRAPLAASPNMTLLEKVRLLGSQTSPLLSSVREDCPAELVQLVNQLLSRDPAARPASAAHVAQALEPFCNGSQLAQLLATAQAAAVAEPIAEPAVEPAIRSLAQPSSLQFADAVDSSKTPTKPPAGRWLWAAAAAIPLMIFAGILITIETQKGQLVIQSDMANVQIKVARDGNVVDELMIHPGAQSTRLRADKYEILIDSPSDQVVIDKEQFSIKSGETVVATIKRAAQISSAEKLAPTVGLNSNETTYKLIGYSEWLHVLATDTDSEKQVEALNAIIAIGAKRNISDARTTIADTLRAVSKSGYYVSAIAQIGFRALYGSFDNDADRYYEFLTNEIGRGPSEWSQSILLNDSGSGLVDAAIRIVSTEKSTDPQLLQAAVQHLTDFIGRAKTDTSLETLKNKAIDALVANPELDRKYWFDLEGKLWKDLGRRPTNLGELFTRVGEMVMVDPQSSTEDRRRALSSLSTYEGKLKESAWIEGYANSLLNEKERLIAIYRFQDRKMLTNESMEGLHRIRFEKNSITALYILQGYQIDVCNEMFELLCVIYKHGYLTEMKPLLERILQHASSGMPDYATLVNRDPPMGMMRSLQGGAAEGDEVSINLSTWRSLNDTQRAYALIAITVNQLLGGKFADSAELVNDSATAPMVSKKEPPISAEPFFDGRTLSQWFEILERDRDVTARSTAMSAIRSLTSKAESSQVTERLIALARQAKADEWSDYEEAVNLVKYGVRGQSTGALDVSLIGLLIHLNGKDWFKTFLATDLLKGEDIWTARWLAALLKSQRSWRGSDFGATIYERFKEKEVFDTLGPNTAWLAVEWFMKYLGSGETIANENIEHVIDLIEHQPHLGKMVVLQVSPDIETLNSTNNSGAVSSNANRPLFVVEAALAKYAKKVLESDDASPEAVARAASRLASTTAIVVSWKTDLVQVLHQRLGALAKSHTRLTTMLPVEPKTNRSSFGVSGAQQSNPFAAIPIPVKDHFETEPGRQRVVSRVVPYIESEAMALIALLVRLDVAAEMEDTLAKIATETAPDFNLLMTQSGASDLRAPAMFWPYRLGSAGEPWTKISAETWLGWAIHRTLFEYYLKEKVQLPLLNEVLTRTTIKLTFMRADRNSDGKLTDEEFPQKEELVAADSNKDGSLDFEEFLAFAKLIQAGIASRTAEPTAQSQAQLPMDSRSATLEWAKRQVSKYDTNRDGKLSAEERKPMLVDPIGADSNGDGEVTVEEYAKSRERR